MAPAADAQQLLGWQSETGDVRSGDRLADRDGVKWLAGRDSRCYGSEHSGSKTKQALSRYKLLTDAITTAQQNVSTQMQGRR